MNKNNKKSNSILSIVVLFIVAILFSVILLQGVKIKETDDMISISGGLFYSEEIAYSDIKDIELRDVIIYGNRVNGASLLKYRLGNFKNDEFGNYKLFADSSIGKFIVLKYKENTIVFNFKDLSETNSLYNRLLEKSKLNN